MVNEKGIALIPDVLTRDEVAILLSTLKHSAFRRSRAGIRHLMSNDIVADLARDPRMATIAGSILSGDAIPFRATLFDKSSDANWLVAWHQDRALPLRARIETPGWGPWSVKDGIHYAHAPACVLEQVVALRPISTIPLSRMVPCEFFREHIRSEFFRTRRLRRRVGNCRLKIALRAKARCLRCDRS